MQKHFFRSFNSKNSSLPQFSPYQFHDTASHIIFLISVVFILLNVYLVFLNFPFLPPQIPLFFQRVWGTDQLGNREMIWLQPGVLVVCFLVNYGISLITTRTDPLISRILGVTLLICSVMSLISVWHIMNLVIFVRLWF